MALTGVVWKFSLIQLLFGDALKCQGPKGGGMGGGGCNGQMLVSRWSSLGSNLGWGTVLCS